MWSLEIGVLLKSLWAFKISLLYEKTVELSIIESLYKTLARPVLCNGSEAWTMRINDINRITASEMKFIRATAGYTRWDHERNEDVLREL